MIIDILRMNIVFLNKIFQVRKELFHQFLRNIFDS
jgi:hypothetical protein